MAQEPEVLAVLFTDLAGSTRLLSELGDDAADALRRSHFTLLRAAIADHRGREVKSLGDGLMVAFTSAREAVACAAAMQRAVSAQRRPLGLRVGIDAGEPIADGSDLFGTPVVVARRLCDAAEAGQVLVSDVVRLLCGRRLEVDCEAVGELQLKGLDQPVVAHAVGWQAAAPRVRLCGELAVEHKGTRLDDRLPSRQARLLFALLVLERRRALSREAIADALWPDTAPRSREGSIRSLLSGVRRVFGTESLQGRDSVRLVLPQGTTVDVEQAEAALAKAEAALARGDPEEAEGAARDAAELASDELLAGLSAPWIDERRAALDELSLRALEIEASAAVHAGRVAEAERAARRVIERAPYRESAYALLMQALAAAGNVSEATLAFDGLRTLLRDELGTAPAPGIVALHDGLLAGGAPARPREIEPVARLPVVLERAAERPFVARAHELDQLRSAWAAACRGDARLVVLAGEPGVGKTTLTAQLARELHDDGATVLLGRCHPEALVPYEPWVEALRQLPGELLREQAHVLGRLMPELASKDEAPARADDPAARYLLFEAVAGTLAAAAEHAPLLIVVDDLHWADEPALLLLRHIARAAEQARLLILGTYRTTEVAGTEQVVRSLADLAREVPCDRMALSGLDDADVAAMIAAVTGHPSSFPLGAAMRRDTAGNPLFVSQLLRHLEDTGALVEREGELVLSASVGRLGVPDSVKDLVGTRLSALAPSAVATLRTAAVIGREFGDELLSAVDERPARELLAILEEAGAAGLVEEVAAGRHAFAHAVVREAIYDQAGATRRADLHGRVATALEASGKGEPAELAHHFLAAGDRAKSLEYSLASAGRASAQLAYEDAAAHYENALGAMDPDDGTRRYECLLALGDAQDRAGDAGAARSTFLQAAGLARSAGLPELLARAAAAYGGRFLWTHALADEQLVPLLEEALAALGDADAVLRVQLLSRLAAALRHGPTREYRDRIGEEAIRIARRSGDDATLAYALTAAHAALHAPGNAAARLEAGSEIVRLATSAGDRERRFDGHEQSFWAAWELGDPERRALELGSLVDVADELRQPAQLWALAVAQSTLALSQGRFAPELIEQAAALGEGILAWGAAATRRLQLFMLRREQGRLDGFEPEVRDHAEEFPSPLLHGAVLGQVYARLGRLEEAAALLREITARDLGSWHVDEEWLLAVCLLAETCAVLEDAERAARLYEVLLPFGGLNAVGVPELALGSASRTLGELASVLGRFDDASGHFDEALRMNARMGAAPWVAHTQADCGRMLLRRGRQGDRERAEELLSHARAAYRELGMHGDAATAKA